MPKIVTFDSGAFRGRVVLSDPLTYPQLFAFKAAHRDTLEETNIDKALYLMIPGIDACVMGWELTGIETPVTMETFPATPALDSIAVLSTLAKAISDIIKGETIPKNS